MPDIDTALWRAHAIRLRAIASSFDNADVEEIYNDFAEIYESMADLEHQRRQDQRGAINDC